MRQACRKATSRRAAARPWPTAEMMRHQWGRGERAGRRKGERESARCDSQGRDRFRASAGQRGEEEGSRRKVVARQRAVSGGTSRQGSAYESAA